MLNKSLKSKPKKTLQDIHKELLFAVQFNMVDKVKILLENGADANDVFSEERVIYLAIKNKNTEIVRLLIDHGANLNVYDDFCGSPSSSCR